ncbi:MAG: hypothetical protein AAGA96_12600 [Verrucomicrobiota bacterium]
MSKTWLPPYLMGVYSMFPFLPPVMGILLFVGDRWPILVAVIWGAIGCAIALMQINIARRVVRMGALKRCVFFACGLNLTLAVLGILSWRMALQLYTGLPVF